MHLFANLALRLDITLVLLQLSVICLLGGRLRGSTHLPLVSTDDYFLTGHHLTALRLSGVLVALVIPPETRLRRKRLLHALLDRLLS